MRRTGTTIEIAMRLNWDRLFRYAIGLTGNADDANDLLQQSVVNALAAPSVPDDPEAVRVWLFRVARNVWIDRYRRQKVRAENASAVAIEFDAGWAYEDRFIAEITVKQGLSMIDPQQREVIELVDIWGFRYVEAATILDIPVGTVMSRLSRARLSLLEAIAGGNVTPLEFWRAARK